MVRCARHSVHATDSCATLMSQLKRMIFFFSDFSYDMVHFGHANSLRQAKALGKHFDFILITIYQLLFVCALECINEIH